MDRRAAVSQRTTVELARARRAWLARLFVVVRLRWHRVAPDRAEEPVNPFLGCRKPIISSQSPCGGKGVWVVSVGGRPMASLSPGASKPPPGGGLTHLVLEVARGSDFVSRYALRPGRHDSCRQGADEHPIVSPARHITTGKDDKDESLRWGSGIRSAVSRSRAVGEVPQRARAQICVCTPLGERLARRHPDRSGSRSARVGPAVTPTRWREATCPDGGRRRRRGIRRQSSRAWLAWVWRRSPRTALTRDSLAPARVGGLGMKSTVGPWSGGRARHPGWRFQLRRHKIGIGRIRSRQARPQPRRTFLHWAGTKPGTVVVWVRGCLLNLLFRGN